MNNKDNNENSKYIEDNTKLRGKNNNKINSESKNKFSSETDFVLNSNFSFSQNQTRLIEGDKTRIIVNKINKNKLLESSNYIDSSSENNNNNNINNKNQNNFNNNINNQNKLNNNYQNNYNINQNNFNNNPNLFYMNQNLNNNSNNFNYNQIQNNYNNNNYNNMNNNSNQNLVNTQNNNQMMNNNFSGNFNFNNINNNCMDFQQNNYNNGFNNNNNYNINNFNNNTNNYNNINNNQIDFFNNHLVNNTAGFNNNMMMNMGQIPNQNNYNFQNNNFMPFNNINSNNNNQMNNYNFTFGNDNMNNQAFNSNNFNNNMNNNMNNNTSFNNSNQSGNSYLEDGNNLSNIKPGIQLIYPHLMGLQNIGQTCYMNSTLQCLSNIKEITDYLLNNFTIFNQESNPLTTSYTNLLFKLFFNQEGKKYEDPTNFKTIIGDLNPLFKGFKAADSKDLLFFIIEKLHNELNKRLQNMNIIQDFNIIELQSRDENKMLQNFLQEFSCTNNSIISNTFYGILRTKITCIECNITKYSFQSFNMQIFQLKKIKEDKYSQLGNYYDKLNLLDCFIYSGIEEMLDGDNMIYCNNCHRLTKGINKQDFYELPKILIIVLNRGKNNADFNDEFIFPENIDFSNQNILLNPQSRNKYYLMSVITHLGESGSSGHFIAYVRKEKTDIFYCYNDAYVSEVNINYALKQKISQREDEKVTPYILFYHCYE